MVYAQVAFPAVFADGIVSVVALAFFGAREYLAVCITRNQEYKITRDKDN